MSPVGIAIAGATGDLVARRFLSPGYYPSRVAKVKFFTRNARSVAAQELITLGVKAIENGMSAGNVKGIDLFVNVLGEGTSLEDRNAYVNAAAEAGVKTYIPTEFGM
ncbi:hypothetical protein FRC04_009317 [Tulasnella sp. 424]|nr:hypothetical protein FRC04_009317 [Tulasnella sp. 424]KAG8964445.1 hypothetical protein FRC05_003819 [Tulasnella sp. 425]